LIPRKRGHLIEEGNCLPLFTNSSLELEFLIAFIKDYTGNRERSLYVT